MQCMKCGRDVENGEVFCAECQEIMAKYPVKPGTVVQLPHRTVETAAKKQQLRRRPASPEEQLVVLKRILRKLALTLLVSVVLCIGLGYYAVTQLLEDNEKPAVGQNYYVATTAPETTETPGADTQYE